MNTKELIIGKISGKEVIAMNGRFHYYEGYDLKESTFPVRVFKLLGVEKIVITNAAGGVNTSFQVGDFMVINDYLSFFAESVLPCYSFSIFRLRKICLTSHLSGMLLPLSLSC